MSIATATSERIILTVDKSRKKAFVAMLKLFDFVRVETPEDVLRPIYPTRSKKCAFDRRRYFE